MDRLLLVLSLAWALLVAGLYLARHRNQVPSPIVAASLPSVAGPLPPAPGDRGHAGPLPVRPVAVNSPASAPTSVEPSSGDGKEEVFVVRSAAPAGKTLREVRILFSAGGDGRKACYVYYNREQNVFRLVDDAGSASTGLRPGDSDFLANSQCRLDGRGSSVEGNGQELTVSPALRFYSSFPGEKTVYTYAESQDGWNTGLEKRGTWTVPSSYLDGTAR